MNWRFVCPNMNITINVKSKITQFCDPALSPLEMVQSFVPVIARQKEKCRVHVYIYVKLWVVPKIWPRKVLYRPWIFETFRLKWEIHPRTASKKCDLTHVPRNDKCFRIGSRETRPTTHGYQPPRTKRWVAMLTLRICLLVDSTESQLVTCSLQNVCSRIIHRANSE